MPQVLCAKLMDLKQKNSTLYKMLYAALLEMAYWHPMRLQPTHNLSTQASPHRPFSTPTAQVSLKLSPALVPESSLAFGASLALPPWFFQDLSLEWL